MIISDFYQTKIEVVKSSATSTPYYNVNIDANDVLVIVSLIDFNGSPVVGRDVTLTVDRGSFTGVASGVSSSPSGSVTSSTSCHATTDSNGKISALYTASEWGLATFSTNNINTQIKVEGWKLISTLKTSDPIIKLYSNDELVHIIINSGDNNNTSVNNIGQTQLVNNIPSEYQPYWNISIPSSHTNNTGLIVIADNLIIFRWNNGNGTSTFMGTGVTYPKK